MRRLTLRIYEIIPNRLYQSGLITEYSSIKERNIDVIIDLEGGLDTVIPTPTPGTLLYICYPILDNGLPDMIVMHYIAQVASNLIHQGHKVLSHCAAGVNRASLMNGLILYYYDTSLSGEDIVRIIQERRPGSLTNDVFRNYLLSLKRESSTKKKRKK